jgi:hypothetical protein
VSNGTYTMTYDNDNRVAVVDVAEFDYTLRADGSDAALNESFWTTAGTLTNAFSWAYDNLDRLVAELVAAPQG